MQEANGNRRDNSVLEGGKTTEREEEFGGMQPAAPMGHHNWGT